MRVQNARVDAVSCNEKHRLLEEYEAAKLRFFQAVDDHCTAVGTHSEHERLKDVAAGARRTCGETMTALLYHRFTHGC
jgi:hypothetical protein